MITILLLYDYQLSCLEHFHFVRYNSFSSEICVVLQWNSSYSSIFLYLISCTKLLFQFFSCQYICCEAIGKHCFKSPKYHENEVYYKCFQHSILTLSRSLLLMYQVICLHICYSRINSFAFLHILTNQRQYSLKSKLVAPNIFRRKIKPIVLVI